MKILLVSPLPPPIGGIASWTTEYMKQMPGLGCTPILVNSAVEGKRAENTSKVSFFEEIIRLMKLKRRIKKVLKQNNISVIHYNASCSTFGLIRDYFALKQFSKYYRIVYHCHCNLETNVDNRIARYFFSKISKIVAYVLTLNKDSFRFAGKFTSKVKLVPNFINQIYVDKPKVNVELKNIAFVGRVSESKGIYELLEAAQEVPQINFHIIGPDNDNILNGTKFSNVIIHGAQLHDKVIDILKTMDVLLLPSYSEGFPLVVMEAMACGLPVIATSVGSIPDMICDKGGVLIPVKDSKAIVDAIYKLNNIALRSTMADYNLNKVQNEYLSEHVLCGLIELYCNIRGGNK